MVKEVNAETLKIVLDSWEELKKVEDYEKVPGLMVMKFLFEKCGKAKPMFGYDIEAEIDEEFFADPRFVAHAVKLIAMFYTALGMIGPDGILLAEEIRELGEKHVNYGVRAEMFPITNKGLTHMLETQLGDKFTEDVRKAWRLVSGAISEDLMCTVLKASKGGTGVNVDNRSAIAA